MVVVADFHFLLSGSDAAFVVVVEGGGDGERLVFIFVQILQFWQPVAVAGLVVYEQEEGFVFVALVFQPVDGLVGDDIGKVSLLLIGFSLHVDEVGVVIVALRREVVVIVESRRRANEVPFSD